MRMLRDADNCALSVVRVKGSGVGFAAEVEVRGAFVILHPVPRAYSEMVRHGEEWYGEFGDIKEVGVNPHSGKRIFVQPFIPITRRNPIRHIDTIKPIRRITNTGVDFRVHADKTGVACRGTAQHNAIYGNAA